MKPNCQECGKCCCVGFNVWLDETETAHFESKPALKRLINTSIITRFATHDSMMKKTHGKCVAFRGKMGKKCHCRIYEDRPKVCRSFPPDSQGCQEAQYWIKMGIF